MRDLPVFVINHQDLTWRRCFDRPLEFRGESFVSYAHLQELYILENLKNAALLDVHILTGRTHQIRVHMQSLHHPVAGDPIYGLKNGVKAPRLMLHAHTLAFDHPRTGERLFFKADPPEAFEKALKKLR